MAALALCALLVRLEANEFWDLYILVVGSFALLNLPYWLAAPYLLRIRDNRVRAVLGAVLCSPLFVVLAVDVGDSLIRHGKIYISSPSASSGDYVIILLSLFVSWIQLIPTRYERVSAGNESKMKTRNWSQFKVAHLLIIQAIAGGLILTAIYGGTFYFVTNAVLLFSLAVQRAWFHFATRNWVRYREVAPRERFAQTRRASFDFDDKA